MKRRAFSLLCVCAVVAMLDLVPGIGHAEQFCAAAASGPTRDSIGAYMIGTHRISCAEGGGLYVSGCMYLHTADADAPISCADRADIGHVSEIYTAYGCVTNWYRVDALVAGFSPTSISSDDDYFMSAPGLVGCVVTIGP